NDNDYIFSRKYIIYLVITGRKHSVNTASAPCTIIRKRLKTCRKFAYTGSIEENFNLERRVAFNPENIQFPFRLFQRGSQENSLSRDSPNEKARSIFTMHPGLSY